MTGAGEGRVEGIFLAPEATAEPVSVREASAVAGRGLDGDRYHAGQGTYTKWKGSSAGEALTVIEAEALEALASETGIVLPAGASRRNVVTRGIALDELVGRRFRIGAIECYGDRPCPPCRHLERLTEDGVMKGLVGRGGLYADIVSGGRLAVGDLIAVEP